MSRGIQVRQLGEVLDQARAVADRERPRPGPADKERHARRLSAFVNERLDAKDDPEVDELVAESRRLGWL